MASPGRRVLVVDDDRSSRSLVVAILRSWGHDVVAEVGTVEEALAHARAAGAAAIFPKDDLVGLPLRDTIAG